MTASRRYWPRRFTVLALSFAAIVICYVDRTNISVAIIPMAGEFGWDKTTMGIVLSAFFYGYFATQILGGWLADRFGGKIVLGTGVLVWSLFTVLTPPAAVAGFWPLLLARVGLGLGEGVTFPSVYSIVSSWTPAGERARAIGLNMSGVPVGTVVALVATPLITIHFGWPMAFYSFGALGLAWWALWQRRVTSTPGEHPTIAAHELAHIGTTADAPTVRHQVPWRRLLAHPAVWAIIVCHFCSNWGGFVLLAWLPTYLNQALGVDLAAVGLFAMVPFALSVTGINAAGWVADHLIRRGFSVTSVRKIMQTIGFGTSATLLLLIGGVTSAPIAIILMSVGAFFGAMAIGGFGVSHLDIAPRHAGVLMGLSNTAGTIPGVIGVTASGVILDATGSWALVFAVAAALYVAGLVVWLACASGERLFD